MEDEPARPNWNDAPEEPLVVERPDGLEHLPEVRARAFLGLVRAGQRLEQRLDDELRRAHRISLRAFEVLLHLAVFSPDRQLRMSQLAAQTPLSQSRVSRLVGELEERGLVRRSSAPEDSRAVDVELTDEGLEAFIAAQRTHLAGLDRYFFSHLSWEDVTRLATVTETILEQDPGRTEP